MLGNGYEADVDSCERARMMFMYCNMLGVIWCVLGNEYIDGTD